DDRALEKMHSAFSDIPENLADYYLSYAYLKRATVSGGSGDLDAALDHLKASIELDERIGREHCIEYAAKQVALSRAYRSQGLYNSEVKSIIKAMKPLIDFFGDENDRVTSNIRRLQFLRDEKGVKNRDMEKLFK
ncbi:MAG: hypothetical protein AAF449_14890, partial [Myxococcota bacterium]